MIYDGGNFIRRGLYPFFKFLPQLAYLVIRDCNHALNRELAGIEVSYFVPHGDHPLLEDLVTGTVRKGFVQSSRLDFRLEVLSPSDEVYTLSYGVVLAYLGLTRLEDSLSALGHSVD